MGSVRNNGNLILGFCTFGICIDDENTIDSKKLSNFHTFFEINKSVNVFTNTNITSIPGYLDGKNTWLTYPTGNDHIFKWLMFNGSGMLDAGFDLRLGRGGVIKSDEEAPETPKRSSDKPKF